MHKAVIAADHHATGHHDSDKFHDHGCGCAAAQNGPVAEAGYRRILWIALIGNAMMFFVETIGGLAAQSTSLMADAIDFFGDTLSFAVSLFVLSMALIWRARVALLKGFFMASYGVGILVLTLWNMQRGVVPEATTMSIIGLAAFIVNLGVALLLYRYRTGDANMRSVWLCSRNDALSNLAIIAAAAGVFGTGTAWPDIIVAVIMATLGFTAGLTVIRQARAEIKTTR
jgi:Co/Zn/Cd efflux system component